MSKVIVPSEFTKQGLTKKATPITDIDVVPEAYFSELTNDPKNDPYMDLIKTDFNFLTVGVLTGNRPGTDRKNLFYLIKWFKEAFEGNKDVGLIIKTNSGRDTEIDKKMTRGLLKTVLEELNHDGTPSIYLLHGGMEREEMNELYKSEKVKAYVSATRGEGFGLPLLEAAVTGLPVIATDWSAHTEFLNKGKWVKIENSLKPVAQEKLDKNIFLEGMRWAEVDESDFKQKIKKFYNNDTLPRKWAKDLSKTLKKDYSQESINAAYDAVLGEILD
jgi:glycosyltransferase involved in cell wall biosynthesis